MKDKINNENTTKEGSNQLIEEQLKGNYFPLINYSEYKFSIDPQISFWK